GIPRRRQATAPADVAQLVEHFTRNEGVPGSSPGVGFAGQCRTSRNACARRPAAYGSANSPSLAFAVPIAQHDVGRVPLPPEETRGAPVGRRSSSFWPEMEPPVLLLRRPLHDAPVVLC